MNARRFQETTVLLVGLLLAGRSWAAQPRFLKSLGGIGSVEAVFNPDTQLAVDGVPGGIVLSGTPHGEPRAAKYLAARMTLRKPRDLTRTFIKFEFKGDPGDLFVRAFNEKAEKPSMHFKSYSIVDSSEWREAVLLFETTIGRFVWNPGECGGSAPTNTTCIDIVYRPAKLEVPARIEIRNLRFEEPPPPPEFSRIISEPLTVADLKPDASRTQLIRNDKPVARVIVPAAGKLSEAGKKAMERLNAHYGATFKPYRLKPGQMKLPKGNYILFSDGVRGIMANRLLSHFYLDPQPGCYEVRNIRNAFDVGCNILYFGGMNETNLLEGVDRFIQGLEKTDGALAVGKYIDHQAFNSPDKQNENAELARDFQKKIDGIYADPGLFRKNSKAIVVVRDMASRYNNTGDEVLIENFMELVRTLVANYESSKDWRKTPPSFQAQDLAFAVDLVDESENLSDGDLVVCGNLMRQIAEDCMNFYEMKEPMYLYDFRKTRYLTNHPLFASRSVSALGRFLKKRFEIPAADYWIAVSANAYQKIAEADQGLEDSSNYQWKGRRLAAEFALQSGEMPLATSNLREYVDFAIAHYNQMGNVVSYGDAIPMKENSPLHLLAYGYKYYNDNLSACVLRSSVRPGGFVERFVAQMGIPENPTCKPRMVGLAVFPMCDFLKEYFKLGELEPLLNKAVFRSGYAPEDEYLMVGGMDNPKDHGHFDANAIVEFSRGKHYWLVDGDYIKTYPREHNTIEVSRNAVVPDWRRETPCSDKSFAKLKAAVAAKDGSQGILVSSLPDHGGLDWARNIFWTSKKGFWVVDQLQAGEAGHYVVKCIWRTLGEVELRDGTVEVVQKESGLASDPNHFYIARGDEAPTGFLTQFDVGHDGPFGYYDSYAFADPDTKVVVASRDLNMKQGARFSFVNHLSTGDGTTVPEVRKVAASSWVVDGEEIQLAVFGKFQSSELRLKAERALLSPSGLIAINASALQVGDVKIALPRRKTFSCKFGEGVLSKVEPERIQRILAEIHAQAKPVALQGAERVKVPKLVVSQQMDVSAPIRALAAADGRMVCGLANGRVAAFSADGQPLWEAAVGGAPVTALAPVRQGEQTLWAVGTRYENREDRLGYVALISADGQLRWKKPVKPYHERPGTIRTITAAKLRAGEEQQIVAGSESWKYVAFDLDGAQLWKSDILHAATVCAAADMNGDGLDEIAEGSEYYYHWIVNEKGERLKANLSSPGDSCVATIDVTGDGVPDAIWGHDDGFIKVMRPGSEEKRYFWETNVGGRPTGIVEAPDGGLAVSTDNHVVVFLDDSGKQSGAVYFPDDLLGLERAGNSLYTVCRDGMAYRFSRDGIDGMERISNPVSKLSPPLMASVKGHLVVSFGTKVFVLKELGGN